MSDTKIPIRGEHEIRLPVPWRLDGPADPSLPLVLCLHGMGMDEDSFALLVQGLQRLPARLLVPRGPYPVEIRGEGRIGASWYAYDGDQDRFRRELERTEEIVLGLLAGVEASQGLRPRARVLLGFSQGGYCGAWIAVRNALFDGMIISGARVKTEILGDAMPAAAARRFAALLLHGERDASVSPEAAARGRDALRDAGIDVEHHVLDSGHSLGRRQIEIIGEWMERRWR
ncbi:MAG: alpha/beta hydrolase [Candidatus Eiseniibacteriota bacterium]